MDISVKMAPQKLVDFSEQHLYYEIAMLYGVNDILDSGLHEKEYYVFSALLESFVIHTSIILDFFYKPQDKADDASAVHYMDDPKKWGKLIPPFHKHFREFTHQRNKRVAHLSYKRLDSHVISRPWNCHKLVKEIRKIVDLFLDNANPAYLHPKFYRLHSRNYRGAVPLTE